MMKHELAQPQVIEGFSVLKMKQEIQAEIYRETEGMTNEEFRAYIREGAEKFRKEIECCRAERKLAESKSPL